MTPYNSTHIIIISTNYTIQIILDTHVSFLEKQSTEYQTCLEALRNVRATLEHQQNIEISRIIPKKYQPKLLKTSEPTLMEEFRQNYNDLFFQQLERAITSNTIELSLLESRSASILTQTEDYLSTLSLPPEDIKILYNKFLRENGIENHTPLPVLQSKVAQDQPLSTPSITHHKSRRPKRKCPAQAPQPNKQSKQDPFLSIRLPKPPPPS